ncbi:MAG: hypothetical protein ACI9QQ_002111 [Myxococcota bacterium]|jgi:hypothetical protein
MKPQRGRRVHLGIRREELRDKSYAKFFRWDMAPLPAEVEKALGRGESRGEDVLQRADANRLLEPGYHSLETGYATLPDGTVHVSVLTQFPGATGYASATSTQEHWQGLVGPLCRRNEPPRELLTQALGTRVAAEQVRRNRAHGFAVSTGSLRRWDRAIRPPRT